MRGIFLFSFTIFILVVSGCANGNNDSETSTNQEKITQPIHYETPTEKKERLGVRDKTIGEQGGYPQSDQNFTNNVRHDSSQYTNVFINEESINIENHLKNFKEIKAAQVASTDDRMVIGVLLNDHVHDDHHIATKIEHEVKKIVDDKVIVVITDDKYWDRMRNLQARTKRAKYRKGTQRFF